MADFITQFAADEGVSRENFNSRITETNTALTTVEGKANAAQSIASTALGNAAVAQTAAEAALPKAGGTMTGELNFTTGTWTGAPVTVTGGDVNGALLRIQAGGAAVIGAGEAPQNLINAEPIAETTEYLHLCADSTITLWTNCQTIANRKAVTVSATGAVSVPDNTDYGIYKARNIAAGTGAMTAGSTALASGSIYLQYE